MHRSQGNRPPCGTSWCNSFFIALLLPAVVMMLTPAWATEAQALTLFFDQSAYGGKVWLQIQDPNYASTSGTNFQATYAGGTQSINFLQNGNPTLMSEPVLLSAIGSGGLAITYSNSAVFFLYYDDPSANSRTSAPAHMVSTQRFQPFELTMMGGSGDQGNLTAINYFTAPLGIRSYSGNPKVTPTEPVLQQTGYGSTTAAQIGRQLAALVPPTSTAVIRNAKNQVVRYLGPSNFTGANPWPSFIPYTQAVHTAGQSTTILRTNGFNFAAPDNTPVYQFGADMTLTANADGSLSVTGKITATASGPITSGNPALPDGNAWDGATISFSVATPDDFNDAIYGQTANGAVSFGGAAWTDFQTFTQNTRKNPALPHDPATNPSLDDLGAFSTTQAMIIGEITTALLGGFCNSPYMVNGTAIKNMASNQWWSLNPMVAFSTIQTQNPYYNTYADVIYKTSNNTVYGVPYSDRFGQGPLVNTVLYNSSSVGYWIVSVGAPLGAPPKAWPGIMKMLLLP